MNPWFPRLVVVGAPEEVRMDYMDVHGGRGSISPGVVISYVAKIKKVAGLFETLDPSAPQKDFFRRMAISRRISRITWHHVLNNSLAK